uniref:Uncharacterized protein n=1 Tax=Arundo donax TaxID=35708 RepID=A0A0A9CMN1_ARUDO
MPSLCSVSSKSGFTYFSLLSASSTAISKIWPLSVPRITSLVDASVMDWRFQATALTRRPRRRGSCLGRGHLAWW